MTCTTERTEAGDQFVAPGFETTDAERVASVRHLQADAVAKVREADRIGDRTFAAAMRAEVERLACVLDDLRRLRRVQSRQDQRSFF